MLIAPNFAIGAVLMMRFAAEAAGTWRRPRSSSCTTTSKLDAPSGTAARTAELMAAASGQAPPPIHSVRLPGLVANQEVIFGDIGQTLSDPPRHDRPRVVHAWRAAGGAPRRAAWTQSPVVGLENLLF